MHCLGAEDVTEGPPNIPSDRNPFLFSSRSALFFHSSNLLTEIQDHKLEYSHTLLIMN
jgi:hypothetical protein